MDYREQIRKCSNGMERLVRTAKNEGRTMTDEEIEDFKKLEAEVDRCESMISIENKSDDLLKKLESPVGNSVPLTLSSGSAKNFGSFLSNVRNVATGKLFDAHVLHVENTAGMSTSVGADGGFMVTQELAKDLMKLTMQKSKLLPFVTQRPTKREFGGIDVPFIDETSRADGSRFGGVVASWQGEGTTGVLSKPKLGRIELPLSKLMAFCATTEELFEDTENLASFISDLYSSEIAFKIDDAILTADGNGLPLGIFNSPALIEVDKESGQGAGTIVYENLCKMWSRVSVRNMNNLVWIVNREALPELMTMTSPGIAPRPVYLPPEGASAAPYGTIFGRPVLESESASSLGTAGDIALCDLSDYIWTDKNGITTDTSIHVYFLSDESLFRFRYRASGIPYTKAAVASKANAAFTLSPYVVLEDR